MRTHAPLLAMAAAFMVWSGCGPTYSPPTRTGIGLMPDKPVPRHGSARLAAHGPVFTMEGRVNVGVHEYVSLDAGWSGAPVEGGFGLFGVEVHLHPTPRIEHLAWALSFGVAAGQGGEYQVPNPNPDPHALLPDDTITKWAPFVAGVSLGLDIGVRANRWFGAYLGNRLMVTNAEGDPGDGPPATTWGLHVLGVSIDIHNLFLTPEGGYVWYSNHVESRQAWWVGGAIGVRWGQLPDR